jgi:hypothetical protein
MPRIQSLAPVRKKKMQEQSQNDLWEDQMEDALLGQTQEPEPKKKEEEEKEE